MPTDPAIEAAARAYNVAKFRHSTVRPLGGVIADIWVEPDGRDLALMRSAIEAYEAAKLAAQPAERTAAEMRREVEG